MKKRIILAAVFVVIFLFLLASWKLFQSQWERLYYSLDDIRIIMFYPQNEQELVRLRSTPYKIIKGPAGNDPFGVEKYFPEEIDKEGNKKWGFFVAGIVKESGDGYVILDTGWRKFKFYQTENSLCQEQIRTDNPEIAGDYFTCSQEAIKQGYHGMVVAKISQAEPGKAEYSYLLMTSMEK